MRQSGRQNTFEKRERQFLPCDGNVADLWMGGEEWGVFCWWRLDKVRVSQCLLDRKTLLGVIGQQSTEQRSGCICYLWEVVSQVIVPVDRIEATNKKDPICINKALFISMDMTHTSPRNLEGHSLDHSLSLSLSLFLPLIRKFDTGHGQLVESLPNLFVWCTQKGNHQIHLFLFDLSWQQWSMLQ